jgi:hypothetical protein
MLATTANEQLVLTIFQQLPTGDQTVAVESKRLRMLMRFATLRERYQRVEARYPSISLCGTLANVTSNFSDGKRVFGGLPGASIERRGVTRTSIEDTRLHFRRTLHVKDKVTAPLTGVPLSASFLRTGRSGDAIFATVSWLNRASCFLLPDHRVGLTLEAVSLASAFAFCKRVLEIPQAVVSPTETTICPSAVLNTDFSTQAVVPLTGTTLLFNPPPAPSTTGQTQ